VGGAVTRSRLGPDRGRCPEPSVCHASFQPLAVGRAQERAESIFPGSSIFDNPLCWTARAEAGLLQSIVSPQDMRKVVNEVLRELGPLLAWQRCQHCGLFASGELRFLYDRRSCE